jgi:hypothetical protein
VTWNSQEEGNGKEKCERQEASAARQTHHPIGRRSRLICTIIPSSIPIAASGPFEAGLRQCAIADTSGEGRGKAILTRTDHVQRAP